MGIPVNIVKKLKKLEDQQIGVESELLTVLQQQSLLTYRRAVHDWNDGRKGTKKRAISGFKRTVMGLRNLRTKKKRLNAYMTDISQGLAQLRADSRDKKNLKIEEHLFADELIFFNDAKSFFDSADVAASWILGLVESINEGSYDKLRVREREQREKAGELQILGLIKLLEEMIEVGKDFESSLRLLGVGI
jgi:hypothetical protein